MNPEVMFAATGYFHKVKVIPFHHNHLMKKDFEMELLCGIILNAITKESYYFFEF